VKNQLSASFVLVKILWITAFFGGQDASAAESAKKIVGASGLSEPVHAQSLETIERKIFAVGRSPHGLMLSPERDSFFITAPFNPAGTNRESTFGKMTDSKRVNVGEKSEINDWRAFFPLENRVLAFEGRVLMLLELDSTTFNEIVRRPIQWDTIRPPRDRGGEATTIETTQFRAQFKKAMNATKGLKASGLAPIPKTWLNNGKMNYFMLSRLERFPFLLLECDVQTPSQCVITRGCNVSRKFKTKVADLRGIAISEHRKQILVGDPVGNQLHSFKFNSCYSITHTNSRALPKRMKPLSNLTIDSDDKLFVTTEDPDDYLNASLYFWNKSEW